MFSRMYMAFFNIKKRKLQSVLIALTIVASVMLLSTALAIITNTKDIYGKASKDLNTSQVYVYSDIKYQPYNEAVNYWRHRKGVSPRFVKYFPFSETIKLGSKELISGLSIIGFDGKPKGQDEIILSEGKSENKIRPGEVWMPSGYAYSSNIKLNDKVTFIHEKKVKHFKVTGIFIDPPFGSAMMQPTEVFVSPQDMSYFGDIKKLNYMIKLHFKDYSKSDKLLNSWEEHLKHPVVGNIVKEEQFKQMNSFVTTIASVIMLITALVMTLVIILVIVYSISSDIYGDYKTIGILMAMGFSRRAVRSIYILQYGIIYFISMMLGLFSADLLTHSIMGLFLKSLGYSGISIKLAFPFAIVVALTAAVILLTVSIVARRASQVMPVEAIASGNAKTRSRNGARLSMLFQNFSSTNMMVLKSLLERRGQAIFVCIMAALMVFISLIITNSTRGMKDPDVFRQFSGLGKENLKISYKQKSLINGNDVFNRLKKDRRIKEFFQITDSMEGSICKQGGVNQRGVLINILGYHTGDKNVVISQGKNPTNNNEVAISTTISDLYDKRVGDEIKVFLYGKEKNLIVRGIFSSTQNSGNNIRVRQSLVKQIDPHFIPDTFNVVLKNIKNENTVIRDYKRLPEVTTVLSLNKRIKDLTGFVLGGVNAAIVLINVILWGILLIILFNVITLNILRERKSLGILKTIGFTSTATRLTLIIPIMLMSLAGIILGAVLVGTIGRNLMNGMYRTVGITQCPYLISIFDIAILGTAYIGFVALSTYVPARKILKISPRELIIE